MTEMQRNVDRVFSLLNAKMNAGHPPQDVVAALTACIEEVSGDNRDAFHLLVEAVAQDPRCTKAQSAPPSTLTISNDGPRIVSTNFWETGIEAKGLFYASINAGGIRLLIPRDQEAQLQEMGTAKEILLSWPRNPGQYAAELVFEDGSDSPFHLLLSAAQIDHLPAREDHGRRDLEFTAWTQPRRDGPHEALRRPASCRNVPRLPYLKPWGE